MDNPIVKNVFAVIAGVAVGTLINIGIINISPMIIPPPEGVVVTDTKSLAENIHLFQPINFLMPFLAHALGTLAGAYAAARIAATHKLNLALLIGGLFSIGGIMMAIQLAASPIWFKGADVLLAYIPMAWLGYRLASKE